MYKKTITYTDYDGNERTEDYYFNLSAAELTKKELLTPGGWGKKLAAIANSKDVPSIVSAFDDLVDMAYGEKSDDGRRFVKDPNLTDEFKQTEAYNELIMSFLTDTGAAIEFVNGIIPNLDKYIGDSNPEVAQKLNLIPSE